MHNVIKTNWSEFNAQEIRLLQTCSTPKVSCMLNQISLEKIKWLQKLKMFFSTFSYKKSKYFRCHRRSQIYHFTRIQLPIQWICTQISFTWDNQGQQLKAPVDFVSDVRLQCFVFCGYCSELITSMIWLPLSNVRQFAVSSYLHLLTFNRYFITHASYFFISFQGLFWRTEFIYLSNRTESKFKWFFHSGF